MANVASAWRKLTVGAGLTVLLLWGCPGEPAAQTTGCPPADMSDFNAVMLAALDGEMCAEAQIGHWLWLQAVLARAAEANGETDEIRSPQIEETAFKFLWRAAGKGDRQSQYLVADELRGPDGEMTPAAYLWYRRAADSGLAPAQFQIGMAHFTGMGAYQSNLAGYAWIWLAAQQGFERALVFIHEANTWMPEAERTEALKLAQELGRE